MSRKQGLFFLILAGGIISEAYGRLNGNRKALSRKRGLPSGSVFGEYHLVFPVVVHFSSL